MINYAQQLYMFAVTPPSWREVWIVSGICVIACIAVVVLFILSIRENERLEHELGKKANKYGWKVIRELPAWSKELLATMEMSDYSLGGVHRPIVTASNEIADIIVFGFSDRGLEDTVMDARVIGLARVHGKNFPNIEVEGSWFTGTLIHNLPRQITVPTEWNDKWTITTDAELDAHAFLVDPRCSFLSNSTVLTNLSFKGECLMCAGGKRMFVKCYMELYQELLRIVETLAE